MTPDTVSLAVLALLFLYWKSCENPGQKTVGKDFRSGVYIARRDADRVSMATIDAEILSRLLDAHGAALVLYAQQWCDTPEDVTQEAFLALVRQPSVPDNAVGWLYRVVRNGAINAMRAAQRRSRRETAIARQTASWFQSSADDLLDAAAAVRAMETLPIHEREILVARLWGGLSFEEISELTGSSTSAVHRHYQSSLMALRERLGASCPKRKEKKM